MLGQRTAAGGLANAEIDEPTEPPALEPAAADEGLMHSAEILTHPAAARSSAVRRVVDARPPLHAGRVFTMATMAEQD
jgi:hypothetical protein